MFGILLDADRRCLSASPAGVAPEGAVMAMTIPDGNLHDYRYVGGVYVYDPLPVPPVVEMVEIPAEELADLKEKGAAFDILTEGENA